MRFILILLISQFTFASEISTSDCINKVQEFLKLSDNEAISLTGEGHRSKECFLDSHMYPRFTTNYFAIPFEKRIEYRDRAREILSIRVKPNGTEISPST